MSEHPSLPRLERRARAFRSRLQVRAWEYRQRDHTKGTWLRLARLLADAEAVYEISEEDADRLTAEGHVPEPPGLAVHPPKRMFFVDPRRLEAIDGRRPLPPRLAPALLAARSVAMVRFGA